MNPFIQVGEECDVLVHYDFVYKCVHCVYRSITSESSVIINIVLKQQVLSPQCQRNINLNLNSSLNIKT